MTDTYQANVMCTNCRKANTIDIPKGEEIEQFIDEAECPNCGCSTLYKRDPQP